jgi:hypothetical protein
MHEIMDKCFAVAIGDWLERERDVRRSWLMKRPGTCPSGAPISRLGSIPMSGIAWLQKTEPPTALPPTSRALVNRTAFSPSGARSRRNG